MLESGWRVRHRPLWWSAKEFWRVQGKPDGVDAEVPGDVRIALLKSGDIVDPLVGENTFKSDWIEDRSWWFERSFDAPNDVLSSGCVELVMHGLDCEADVFLNGAHLGHHRSAFYPFIVDVGGKLAPSGNVLLVRVTTGAEQVSKEESAGTSTDFTIPDAPPESRGTRFDHARPYLRKAQYTFGWDHCPRIPSVGIMGSVYIVGHRDLSVRDLAMETISIGTEAQVLVSVELESFLQLSDLPIEATVTLSHDGSVAASGSWSGRILPGMHHMEVTLSVPTPRLWWPNGYGAQDLYDLVVDVQSPDGDQFSQRRVGIRTIRLNTEAISSSESLFRFEINDREVFAQGGNWVPADAIFTRAPDSKYTHLLEEAARAGFTMMRVWGGGIYERDVFYDECDRLGLLVWHDFMLACARYPDDLPWFVDEVRQEVRFQLRRLRSHASIALWCFNNENEMMFTDRWLDPEYLRREGSGFNLMGRHLPELMRENAPRMPYWTSSPFGGDLPNSVERGDVHWWLPAGMNPDLNVRTDPQSYDPITAKFVSEFGYIGPPPQRSIEEYLDDPNFQVDSATYRHHSNGFDAGTVEFGVAARYGTELSREEFVVRAGIAQGDMLGHAFDSMRIAHNNSGAIVWDFDDSWGEVGWSLVDYFGRRKISFDYVRRALAPRRIVLRPVDGSLVVHVLNETPQVLEADVTYGSVSLDGVATVLGSFAITVPPFTRNVHHTIELKPGLNIGLLYAHTSDPAVKPATSYVRPPKDIQGARAVETAEYDSAPGLLKIDVFSKAFAHNVRLEIPDGCLASDDNFDLLPGERRRVEVIGPSPAFSGVSAFPVS